MASAGNVFLDVKPNLEGFQRDMQTKMKGVSASMARVGAGMTKAISLPVVAGFGVAIKAAQDSQKITAQTEAVIKSMGNVAGVSAKDVEGLATAIQKKTGIDDESIRSGQNLLLTFGNIRNEAGKGNKIFDQTTKLMVDMSAALGTDAKGSAIQLGKALNDPIKGISALSRVGVSFTEQQKEQITTLVESGKSMDAQKVILGELENQFGGSAAAQATAAGKMKASMGDLAESFGKILLPIFEKFVGWMSKIAAWFEELSPGGKRLAVRIAAIAAAIGPVLIVSSKLVTAFSVVKTAAAGLFTFLAAHPFVAIGLAVAGLTVLIVKNWDKIKAATVRIWNAIKDFIFGTWDKVTSGTRRFIDGIIGFFKKLPGRIVQAIGDLGGLLIEAGKALIGGLAKGIVEGAGAVARAVGDVLRKTAPDPNTTFQVTPGGGIGAGGSLVDIGRALQSKGWLVGEHSAFGGVAPVHTGDSYHYRGRAIDINWPGPDERTRLAQLAAYFKKTISGRIREMFWPDYDPVGGHQGHLHLAMAKGGYIGEHVVGRGMRSGASYEFGEKGGEYVVPASAGTSLNVPVTVNGPIIGIDNFVREVFVAAKHRQELLGGR